MADRHGWPLGQVRRVVIAPGQRKACDACGTMIVGALTRDGEVMPVEMDPSPVGTVLVFRGEGPGTGAATIHCRTFSGFALGELLEQGVPLRLSHFATCPQADSFRREGS